MISTPAILDSVAEILKASGQPLVAREICYGLQRRGLTIEKTKLNQILWNQNDRAGLMVDKATFKWRYDAETAKQAEEAEKRKAEARREVAKQTTLLEMWETIGLEFIGVRRKETEKPFFYLRKDGDHYLIIGPTGTLLREKSELCSTPDTFSPADFTVEQIAKAGDELFKEHCRSIVVDNQHIIALLRDTESLASEVYLGPAAMRIEDVIPVSGAITVGIVSELESCTLSFGWGVVLEPLYLVIDILMMRKFSGSRHGVFKICMYELLKRNVVVESEGDLYLTLTLDNDRVFIASEKSRLYLV